VMFFVRSAVACALTLASVSLLAPALAIAADVIVHVDQAKLMRLPNKVATIVIGNPLIADASLQTGGQMVITGKGYGTTNIIALDRAGNVLLNKSVEVRGPIGHVVIVYKGIERETCSCTPECQRRITLGDGQAYFDAAIAQTDARNEKAQGKEAAPK
jgi:Pilus formation protein N terminal region